MTKKIGFQTTGPDADSYMYIETEIGKSYAIGSDNLTNSLCFNSSATPGVLPDESTALITLSPQPNTDIDLAPNGTGNVVLLNGNARLATGTTVYSSFTEGALVTDATGVTSTVTGTEGYVLTANAPGTAPSFQALPAIFSPSAFLARLSTSALNVTGDGTVYTIAFNTLSYDLNGDFNTGTFTFTAPATGVYGASVSIVAVGMASGNNEAQLSLVVTGSNTGTWTTFLNPFAITGVGTGASMTTSANLILVAGDQVTAQLVVSGGSKVVGIFENGVTSPDSWFMMFRIS
jgi:hypothetical protein